MSSTNFCNRLIAVKETITLQSTAISGWLSSLSQVDHADHRFYFVSNLLQYCTAIQLPIHPWHLFDWSCFTLREFFNVFLSFESTAPGFNPQIDKRQNISIQISYSCLKNSFTLYICSSMFFLPDGVGKKSAHPETGS